MSEINYYVNEDKGIVVAKIDHKEVIRELEKCYNKCKLGSSKIEDFFNISDFWEDKEIRKFRTKFDHTITAKATCHPEDTFDVNEGKRIARKKLLAKLDKKKLYILKIMEKECISVFSRILNERFVISSYSK